MFFWMDYQRERSSSLPYYYRCIYSFWFNFKMKSFLIFKVSRRDMNCFVEKINKTTFQGSPKWLTEYWLITEYIPNSKYDCYSWGNSHQLEIDSVSSWQGISYQILSFINKLFKTLSSVPRTRNWLGSPLFWDWSRNKFVTSP